MLLSFHPLQVLRVLVPLRITVYRHDEHWGGLCHYNRYGLSYSLNLCLIGCYTVSIKCCAKIAIETVLVVSSSPFFSRPFPFHLPVDFLVYRLWGRKQAFVHFVSRFFALSSHISLGNIRFLEQTIGRSLESLRSNNCRLDFRRSLVSAALSCCVWSTLLLLRGEEGGLLSRTAAGNRAYKRCPSKPQETFFCILTA